MVIKVFPRGIAIDNINTELVSLPALEGGSSQLNIYNSCQSLSSSGAGEKEPRVLFLGFSELWERDLWSTWLSEVSGNMTVSD